MNDFERILARRMRATVPEPRSTISPDFMLRRRNRPMVSVMMPVASAVAVVLVVIGTFAIAGRLPFGAASNRTALSGSSQSTQSQSIQSNTDPKALVGRSWRLVGILSEHGTREEQPGTIVTFAFALDGHVKANSCNFSAAVISAGRMRFTQHWVNNLDTACVNLPTDQAGLVYSLLQGSVSWSVERGVLIVAKPGAGSLRFQG